MANAVQSQGHDVSADFSSTRSFPLSRHGIDDTLRRPRHTIAQGDNVLARGANRMATHVAPLPRNLLDAIASSGIDVAKLARSVGLSMAKLENGVSHTESDRFLAAAWEAVGDPAFGLVAGMTIKPELYSVVGFTALTSPTLGIAFERTVRYTRLVWGDACEMVRAQGKATIRVLQSGPERPYTRAKIDMQLASRVAFANRFTGVSIVPVSVALRRARPKWASRYREVFGCPVRFGQAEDSITFRQRDLDRSLLSANAQISRLLERHAELVLAGLDSNGTAGRVRVVLQRILRGDEPQLARVAEELGMSMRTLQRRLSAEGARFADLLDDVRHIMAQEYLSAGHLNLMEIAFLLGFSDPNSFFRAFRRWTGTTPDSYRRQLNHHSRAPARGRSEVSSRPATGTNHPSARTDSSPRWPTR